MINTPTILRPSNGSTESSELASIGIDSPSSINSEPSAISWNEDHHPIIMTEKDAARCKNFENPRIWYLTVEPKIEESFINDLESRIRSLPSDE